LAFTHWVPPAISAAMLAATHLPAVSRLPHREPPRPYGQCGSTEGCRPCRGECRACAPVQWPRKAAQPGAGRPACSAPLTPPGGCRRAGLQRRRRLPLAIARRRGAVARRDAEQAGPLVPADPHLLKNAFAQLNLQQGHLGAQRARPVGAPERQAQANQRRLPRRGPLRRPGLRSFLCRAAPRRPRRPRRLAVSSGPACASKSAPLSGSPRSAGSRGPHTAPGG